MTDPEIRLTQLELDPQKRPRYTPNQLSAYFERIQLPQTFRDHALASNPPTKNPNRTIDHGLPLLQALVRHHICHVPFENLILHYSTSKAVTLDPHALFDKFVTRASTHGRGGRCMENSTFFATVLRSLGFLVRTCGGRVSRNISPYSQVRANQSQTYDGFNHMLNLVRLGEQWYVVDVGMGSFGPHLVYPLRDGLEVESVAPRRIRLQWRAIPENSADEVENAAKMWCFDVCRVPGEDEWMATYCFTDLEFLPQDYEVMSWYTSTSPRMFFTRLMMVTKMVMSEDGERVVGDLTMVNDCVRRTVGGKREVVCEFKEEKERIEGLKSYFGITLSSEEAGSLSGPLQLA